MVRDILRGGEDLFRDLCSCRRVALFLRTQTAGHQGRQAAADEGLHLPYQLIAAVEGREKKSREKIEKSDKFSNQWKLWSQTGS